MKRKILLSAAVALISLGAYAGTVLTASTTQEPAVAVESQSAKGVDFKEVTFQEALAKAKQENKLIFMDGYAVWCGPCKYMANNVFTQEKAGDFFNKHFVNVKFDMEKGEGIELSKKYRINAYPTFLILDAEGNEKARIVGGDEIDGFIQKVTEILAKIK